MTTCQTYKTYKNMDISSADFEMQGLIVFEDEQSAQEFAKLIGSDSINETTDGFLVGMFGTFCAMAGWSGMLAALEKSNPKITYRIYRG